MKTPKPRTHGDHRLLGRGRDTDEARSIDPRSKEVSPPDEAEDNLPRPVLVRPAGAVALPDWDTEAHAIKDQIIELMRQLSNRRLENGAPSGHYMTLECQILPENGAIPEHQYIRRAAGSARWSLNDIRELITEHQGSTVRQLVQMMFKDTAAPPLMEPRVRALLHRLKLRGWGEARYDEQGVQRWYVADPRGMPDSWDARQRTIAHALCDLLGGYPVEYARQVATVTAAMDAQGERVIDPKAWLDNRERPF